MATRTKQDYYELLGVPRKATAKDIRTAFRKLARKYHPDLNPGDKSAEEKFKQLQEAYDVLSDTKKRQMYDQYGFYSENVPPEIMAPRPESGGEDVNFDFGGFDFGGQPSVRDSSFRDLFGQFFGGRRGGVAAEPEHEPGGDLEYQIEIDFWDCGARCGEEAADHAHGYLRNVPRNRRGRHAANLPDLQRHRVDSADCRENALQRAVQPLRRNGKAAHALPGLRRRGARATDGND